MPLAHLSWRIHAIGNGPPAALRPACQSLTTLQRSGTPVGSRATRMHAPTTDNTNQPQPATTAAAMTSSNQGPSTAASAVPQMPQQAVAAPGSTNAVQPMPQLAATVAASGRSLARGRAADIMLSDPHPLFRDPLLEDMLESSIPEMQKSRDFLLSRPHNQGHALPLVMMSHARFQFGNATVQEMIASLASKGGLTQQLQVVSLGCGWDTRPWMHLGFHQLHTHWFSVDVKEVIEALREDVLAAGAELREDHNTAAGAPHSISTDYKHPLRVSKISLVPCDLRVASDSAKGGLIQVLQRHGFSSSLPTVWLCEGILYYLEGDDVDALLRATAANSAPGSMIAGDVLNEAMLEVIERRRKEAAISGTQQQQQQGSQLDKFFKSAVPGDPEAYFALQGWSVPRRCVEAGEYARSLARTLLFTEDPSTAAGQTVKLYFVCAAHD